MRTVRELLPVDRKFTTKSGAPTVVTESATGVTMFEEILHGTVHPNGFATTSSHPAGVASDAQENIWVVDTENSRLEKFNREGKYITKFGKEGKGKCELNRPK